MATVDVSSETSSPGRVTPSRLGDELPIFCDKCGYSLHGLTQNLCTACGLRHFACPECGSHQALNSWRPAMLRFVGRLRMVGLVFVVLTKLVVAGFIGFLWMAFFASCSWYYLREASPSHYWGGGSLDGMELTMMAILAVLTGGIIRMFLLRFRNSLLVGIGIATFILVVAAAGAWVEMGPAFRSPAAVSFWIIWLTMAGCAVIGWGLKLYAKRQRSPRYGTASASALAAIWVVALIYTVFDTPSRVNYFVLTLLIAMTSCVIGAVLAWPIWYTLVSAFLPSWASRRLLAWQRSLSEPAMPMSTGTELIDDPVDGYAKRI